MSDERQRPLDAGDAALNCGRYQLDLSNPRVMGVLNITPDSFSDGGDFFCLEAALERAADMVEQGADLIDVGGESTRPGAAEVGVEEELRRVLPVIEALAPRLPVPISVDTSRPEVMRAAAAAGASLINDVRALRVPGAVEAALETGLPVCLMHMQGQPVNMQAQPSYTDVADEVLAFLRTRIDVCLAAGFTRERLLVDPGFGFGKSLAHNLALLAQLRRFGSLDVPLLAGLSRKSMLGAVTGRPVGERLAASVAAAVIAARNGARILRVHDVAETVDAMRLVSALNDAEARAGFPVAQGPSV